MAAAAAAASASTASMARARARARVRADGGWLVGAHPRARVLALGDVAACWLVDGLRLLRRVQLRVRVAAVGCIELQFYGTRQNSNQQKMRVFWPLQLAASLFFLMIVLCARVGGVVVSFAFIALGNECGRALTLPPTLVRMRVRVARRSRCRIRRCRAATAA